MKYIPLYIKTDNSLQDSLITIPRLIEIAKKEGFSALTITDSNMYGVMDFYKACIKNEIKPIVGLEVTYKEKKFVLYCKNYNGYKNLLKLKVFQAWLKLWQSTLCQMLLIRSSAVFSLLQTFYLPM